MKAITITTQLFAQVPDSMSDADIKAICLGLDIESIRINIPSDGPQPCPTYKSVEGARVVGFETIEVSPDYTPL